MKGPTFDRHCEPALAPFLGFLASGRIDPQKQLAWDTNTHAGMYRTISHYVMMLVPHHSVSYPDPQSKSATTCYWLDALHIHLVDAILRRDCSITCQVELKLSKSEVVVHQQLKTFILVVSRCERPAATITSTATFVCWKTQFEMPQVSPQGCPNRLAYFEQAALHTLPRLILSQSLIR